MESHAPEPSATSALSEAGLRQHVYERAHAPARLRRPRPRPPAREAGRVVGDGEDRADELVVHRDHALGHDVLVADFLDVAQHELVRALALVELLGS